MAGGTWTAQDKVLPGVYINFDSNNAQPQGIGTRGTVAICEPMSWGAVGQIQMVTAGEDTTPFCGYPISDPNALFLSQIFLGTDSTDGAATVLLYRPAATSSKQATATISPLTATALYPGARGNDITIVVTALTEPESSYLVQTLVDGTVVDEQTAATVSDLVANAWVTWSGDGSLAANTGTALTGGADGTVETTAYTSFLTALEPYQFDVLIYDGSDPTTQSAMVAFVERLNVEDGKACQLVASGLTTPDSQYVINVGSGVVLSGGTTLTAQQATWWVGGAEAGALYSDSLVYAQYPGAVDVSPRLTKTQQIAAIQGGQLILTEEFGVVKIVKDINSLTTYTETLGSAYSQNRVMRICSAIANDIYKTFSTSYIGKVYNTVDGRALFQGAIVGYLLQMQNAGAIQNFTAEDVTVTAGQQPEAVVITVAIQTVYAVEKVYMTVTVS